MNKYKIRHDNRIVALKPGPWGDVGTVGGFVQSESNLSHVGDCWVYDDASVAGKAYVFGDAQVSDGAWVFGNANIFGDARISGDARVYDDVEVFGNVEVFGDALVSGDAKVCGNAWVAAGEQTDDISTNPFFAMVEEMTLT